MGQLKICVTVDWEGYNLQERNIKAMKAFREHMDDVPLTHFICPAYFTRGLAPIGRLPIVQNRIKGMIRKDDEVGLHVHAWESLVRGAGVAPRGGISSYLDGYGPQVTFLDSDGEPNTKIPRDSGHGVPLGIYTLDEIVSILLFARELLVLFQLVESAESVESFRCGGWLASDSVMKAAVKIGMRNDSSAVDASFFSSDVAQRSLLNERSGLAKWLASLWGPKDENVVLPVFLRNNLVVQPVDGKTQIFKVHIDGKCLIQVPDNGLLIDYLTTDEMLDRLNDALSESESLDRVFVCGFHQESAYDDIGRLTEALKKVQEGQGAERIKFQTVREVGNACRLKSQSIITAP